MPISSGVYTVGPNRDYADLFAAEADLAVALIGDLWLLILDDFQQSSTAQFTVDLAGHDLIISCPFPHKGHASSGQEIDAAMIGDLLQMKVVDTVGGGSLTISHFRAIRSGTSTGNASLVHIDQPGAPVNIPHYIHDLILNGNSKDGIGVRVVSDYPCKVWNVKGRDFAGASGALIAIQNDATYADDVRIENCTAHSNTYGVRDESGSAVGKINNCVCFDNGADFSVWMANQIGSGNASKDARAADLVGTGNLDTYDGVTNSPDIATEFVSTSISGGYYLRLNDDAEVLYKGGIATEILGTGPLRLAPKTNAAGSEGNLRPGSDALYSRGADELAEIFPASWSRRARVIIDKDWIDQAFSLGILIRNNAPGLPADFGTTVRAYGDDIRVTEDAEGQIQLPVELFRYGPDDDDFSIWVAREVQLDEDTPVYVWWGNPNATIAPFKGSGASGSGLIGGHAAWFAYAVVFHIGNEFDDPNWCFDSTGEKRHYWADGTVIMQNFSGVGEGRMLTFASNGRCNVPNLGGSSPVLSGVSGLAMMAVFRSSTTPHVDTVIEAVRSGTTRAECHVDDRLVHLDARAPDANPAENVAGDTNLGTAYHVITGIADIDGDRMYVFLDGAIDDDEPASFSGIQTDATDLTSMTLGRQVGGGQALAGQLGEIRVMNTDRNDAYWKIVHANIGAWIRSIDFFVSAYSGGSCMKGLRKLKFDVPGSGPFELENTDFWLDYAGGEDGTIILTLEGIWDKVCPGTAYALVRRQELEAIVRELAQWYQGKTGDLTIDEGHASEKVLSGVKLIDVSWDEAASNAGLIYSMSFGINLGIASGAQAARLLVFGTKALAADNFIVEYTGRDQTAFKPVFRAAPVRIDGGPPIKTVVVTAIVQNLVSGTLLQRRQQAEAIVKDWIDNYLGEEGVLTIDGLGLGTAHLLQIRAGTLDVPDAVGYDMEFAIEYGS